MITIILGLIIAIFIISVFCTDYSFYDSDTHWYAVPVFIFIMGIALALGIKIGEGNSIYFDTTEQLVALKDNINTEGRFYLGGGYIEGNLNYFYYKKIGPDRYKAGKIDSTNATIHESDKETPRIVSHDCWHPNIWKSLFGLNLCGLNLEKEIYVPKGSILQNYKLDLSN